MLQLSQCKLSWQEDSFSKLQKKAAKLLGISVEDFTQFTIVKRSLDARKKPNLFVLYTVRFLCRRGIGSSERNRKNKNLTIAKKEPSLWRQIEEIKIERVAVVGAGPAGLFSAYYLSLCGYSPIVIERGAKMEERHDDILKFWQEGVLKPDSMWRLAREAPVHFGWKIKYQSERQNRKKTVCFTEFCEFWCPRRDFV